MSTSTPKKTAAPSGPNRGGRPTGLTPLVHEAVVKAVAQGNYLETAAAMAGVSRATVFAWLKEGDAETGRPEFQRFAEDVRRAQGEAETRLVETINEAATSDWRAAAWRLERSAPRRWCIKVREVVTAEMNSLLEELAKELSPDDHKKALAVAERIGQAQFDVGAQAARSPGWDLDLLSVEDLRMMQGIAQRYADAKAKATGG